MLWRPLLSQLLLGPMMEGACGRATGPDEVYSETLPKLTGKLVSSRLEKGEKKSRKIRMNHIHIRYIIRLHDSNANFHVIIKLDSNALFPLYPCWVVHNLQDFKPTNS